MLSPLPGTSAEVMNWEWDRLSPHFEELANRDLTADNIGEWLEDWTCLHNLVNEVGTRLQVGTTVNTADLETKERFDRYLDTIFEESAEIEQRLKEKLLASGLVPAGMENPLKQMQAEADLFRTENLPLITETIKLSNDYDVVIGSQTVEWEGTEIPVEQLEKVMRDPDRNKRETAWRMKLDRKLKDRGTLNDQWKRFYDLRGRIAANADKPDFRAYMWQMLMRFDYNPADCETFHRAIEEVVVPAAERIYARKKSKLGVDALRPWDVDAEPVGHQPLRPFADVQEMIDKGQVIFDQLDPDLAAQFRIMVRENLLDLDSRKNKAPGGYCTSFDTAKRPFIFMNSVGVHDDVQTLLHEAGHAFHAFSTSNLPYFQQTQVGSEFCEVASMAMELLAAPYLDRGFYTTADAARAQIEHLESRILFWPYMAVVDAFQHWAYTNPKGNDPEACDQKWAELWDRFMKGIDYSGLETEKATGWHRKLHIFTVPFYYIEYGLAQIGAVQVWRNSLSDPAAALASYRKALALGCTVTLPELFTAAGGKFAFDSATLGELVGLMESRIDELSA